MATVTRCVTHCQPPVIEAIPADLRGQPQWVIWRYETRADGKRTKVPYDARTGRRAKVDTPATWGPFAAALARYRGGGWDGIGFVLSADDWYAGVDLDHCRDPETGEIADWARTIVAALGSYTEITPSGEGLRVWVRGVLPPGGHSRKMPAGGKAELYELARFFTVTGRPLAGTPATIEERGDELAILHARLFPKVEPKSQGPTPIRPGIALQADDGAIVAKVAGHPEYGPLWRGDAGDDESVADFTLINGLAFYCGGPDAERVDRLFRFSGLYALPGRAANWDRRATADGRSYGQLSIDNVLGNKRDYYRWGRPAPASPCATSTAPDEEGVTQEDDDGGDQEPGPDQLTDALAEVARLRGENAQLREQLAERDARIAELEAMRANLQREQTRVRAEEGPHVPLLRVTGDKLSASDKAVAIVAHREIARRRAMGQGDAQGLVPIFRDDLAKDAGVSPGTVSACLKRLHAAYVLRVKRDTVMCEVGDPDRPGTKILKPKKQLLISDAPALSDPTRIVSPAAPRNHGGLRVACPSCGSEKVKTRAVRVRHTCTECGETWEADAQPRATAQEAPAQAGSRWTQDAISATDAPDELSDAGDAQDGHTDAPPPVAPPQMRQDAPSGINAGPTCYRCGAPKQFRPGGYALTCACGSAPPGGAV